MNAALASLLARAAFVHHDDSLGVYQPHRVGMVVECRTGDLHARAAFKHHDDKGHDALMNYMGFKRVSVPVVT